MTVYLDYNSTTPLAKSVQEVIKQSLNDHWANPSSNSPLGRKAKQQIEDARRSVATMIGAKPENIIFTSGGTESNNMAICSVIAWSKQIGCARPHVIISNVEHVATTEPLKRLALMNDIEFTEVAVDRHGLLHTEDILSSIRPTTSLISVMLANNETGVIFPVEDIARQLAEVNKDRSKRGFSQVWIHTDAAQTIGKIPVDVNSLRVDYLTVVGHKFYGPRIGALYCRDTGKTPLYPVVQGGGQERGYRPGTENTPMIAGLGEAAALVTKDINHFIEHMQKLRDYMENSFKTAFGKENIVINCEQSPRLPNTCNVSFVGTDKRGEDILNSCTHVIASTTAACHRQNELSAVLLASGVPKKLAATSVRLSVGRETTTKDIDVAVEDLKSAVKSLTINSSNNNS